MLSITQDPDTMAGYLDFLKGESTYSKTRINSISSLQQKSTDITIMTSEGDKVTISSDSQRQASYLTYSNMVRGGGAMTKIEGKSYSMEVNRELSITVEGDLSVEELADIQKSIKMIDKIMRETLSGNTEKALSMTYDVGSMETISGFSANMEIEKSLSIEKKTITEMQTSIPEPVQSVGTDQDTQSEDRFGKIADKMMAVLKHRGLGRRRFINPMNRYFSKLLEKMSDNSDNPEKDVKAGIVDRIRTEMVERLETESKKESSDDNENDPVQFVENSGVKDTEEIKEV